MYNGILFNHESPRRGANFVTMKIVNGIKKLLEEENNSDSNYVLTLGNIDSQRDWGHAKDYVKGMWLMLQQNSPDDYVLATGYTCSVRQFIERCFKKLGRTIKWEGAGVNEVGKDENTGKIMIKISKSIFVHVKLICFLDLHIRQKKNLVGQENTI